MEHELMVIRIHWLLREYWNKKGLPGGSAWF